MRIWSLHPKYLDRQGLLACWRETLLAQKVLKGETKGYLHHPQLRRFRSCPNPMGAIGSYLASLAEQAETRGYRFDRSKINPDRQADKIPVTRGQLLYEWSYLMKKINRRDPERYRQFADIETPDPHPSFEIVEGPIETWEKIQTSSQL